MAVDEWVVHCSWIDLRLVLYWHCIGNGLEINWNRIGNGLTRGWHHTDDGLALDCPWIDIWGHQAVVRKCCRPESSRLRIALVPLTKWGNVTRIGLVLTWPLPIKCHSSGNGFSVIY